MILFRMFVMKMIVWRWWGWWWWWRWMKRGLRQLDGCSRLILTDVGQQSATPTQLQRLRLIVVKLFGFSTYRLHWCVCTQIQSICSTLHYAASHVNRYLEFLWSLFAKFGCCLHYQPFHRQWRKHNGGFCNGLLSSRPFELFNVLPGEPLAC